MITITLPDGSKREYEKGVTTLQIAESIGERLANDCFGGKVNDVLVDKTFPITEDATVSIITYKSPEGVEIYNHSCAHLLAQALKRLYPNVQLAIGPAVEEGFYYDVDIEHPFSMEDLEKIEAEMKKIAGENHPIVRKEATHDEAREIEEKRGEHYKVEMIDELEQSDEKLTLYEQGEFIDLCRGPHVPSTGKIKSFKLTKIAGAYWRGDAKNKQLQRIYGIAFPDKKMLKEYLHRIEEAKKRDHRVIGKKMDLFSFQEESPGAVFFHPKGTIIFNTLQNFMREEYVRRGYDEVVTPLVYDKSLWETSGHWEHYKEDMFCFHCDGREVSLKPMNCPSHCLIYKTKQKSYRDLPLRIADFAPLHRNELKGVLSGMTRVRKFEQDDAHVFCTLEQVEQEVLDCIDFAKFIYEDVFKFEYHLELSTKPEKALGSKEQWDTAEAALKNALEKLKLPFVVNEGDGAFYGPKIDLHIKDCLGRSWQLATVQLDFQLPQRFELEYEGDDGKKHTPVMIHRAILGSLERFIGILIEHYAGRFPLWLSPVQVKLLPIADRHLDYANEIVKELRMQGIRVEIDARTETTPKKVRDAQLEQVNYILVVGDKEIEEQSVNVRTREGTVEGTVSVSEFVKRMKSEIESKK